jgi:hypothetical protein
MDSRFVALAQCRPSPSRRAAARKAASCVSKPGSTQRRPLQIEFFGFVDCQCNGRHNRNPIRNLRVRPQSFRRRNRGRRGHPGPSKIPLRQVDYHEGDLARTA